MLYYATTSIHEAYFRMIITIPVECATISW